jgi:hypothetical protein
MAVAYINKKEGTHSESLTCLAIQVVRWCEDRNVKLGDQYLPGILNVIADRESRRWIDWQLELRAFQGLRGVLKVSIDLFASPWNAQIQKFVSWNPQPGAGHEMHFYWILGEAHMTYAFPPFAVIHFLSKALREEASILLICPALLCSQRRWACNTPRVFRPSPGLLKSIKGETNPLCSVPGFQLVAWNLSGLSTRAGFFGSDPVTFHKAACIF